ncbi:MAG: substrate-binding domain-containing protein [Chitinispirillaceae bacterium]|jgi:DNA-binding transcriptional regulator YhcF (GntR family)|nr:substrate-binding domain-containing protein [Chitinispirillaceae bacterium]
MKKRPGLQKAIDFIAHGIAGKNLDPDLPPIKSLALAADVSFVTMWKAVVHCRKLGMVSGSKRGKHAGSGSACFDKAWPQQPGAAYAFTSVEWGWKKTLERLKRDILTGKYSAGESLPSMKELQFEYSTSYPTLKKALSALSGEGLITASRRSYAVPVLSKSESTARIVALGCGWEDGTLWIDYQDKNYFRFLESACIKSRIALDIVVYCRRNGRLVFIDTVTGKPYDLARDAVISVMVIVANLGIPLDEVIAALAGINKPIAFLDVIGGWKVPSWISGRPDRRFFSVTASKMPPRLVGQYLLNLGHTNIAFVSPFHKAHWSILRFEELREIFRDAGYPEGVHPFTLDQYAFQWDYLQEDHNNTEDVQTLVAAYDKWKNHADSEIFRKFGNIRYSISKHLTEWNCASGEIYHRMTPQFKRALENRKITAWVMANDYAATLALDYLKEKGVRVPEDISVISFDNTRDAMENQLTSYDFNPQGIISVMLQFALRPSRVPSPANRRVIEIDGAIVERRSTPRLSVKKPRCENRS